MSKMLVVLAVFSFVLVATRANAQEVTRLPEGSRQSVGLDTGLENAFVARATYVRKIDLGADARVFGRLTWPFVAPDLGDWAVDGGVRATPLAWRDFRLALSLGPVVKNTSNEVFSATAAGIGATMLLGYEGPRWGLSAELSYEQLLATHLRHAALYRDTYFAGAKDGWYAASGSTARAGLRGGARFGSVEIFAKAGLNRTGQLHVITPPFYFTIGGAYAF